MFPFIRERMAAPETEGTTTMRTLLLATAAFVVIAPIGAAHAAEPGTAHAAAPTKAWQRYLYAECVAPSLPLDKWTLRFDGFRRDVEFGRTATPADISWGPIAGPTVNLTTSWTAVLTDWSGTRTNLAGVITPDHELDLTWVVGTTNGKMHCVKTEPAAADAASK